MQPNEYPSQVTLSSLIIMNRLGRGATSHVFKAQSISTKQLYALKVIDKHLHYDPKATNREILILRSLAHPNIVSFLNHVEDQNNHYIIMEYCNGGEGMTLLLTQNTQRELACILYQLSSALEYMHSRNYVHCDVKLGNILFHDGQLKLCDFGFSYSELKHPPNNISGTLMYLAPQLLLQKQQKTRQYTRQYSRKSADVWAMGICIICLLTKHQPYRGETEEQLKEQIKKGEVHIPNQIQQDLRKLLQGMLDIYPHKRMTAAQILASPWIQKQWSCSKLQSRSKKSSSLRQQALGLHKAWSERKAMNLAEQAIELRRHSSTETKSSNVQDILLNLAHYQRIFDETHQDAVSTEQNEPEVDLEFDPTRSKSKPVSEIEARLLQPFESHLFKTKNGYIEIGTAGSVQLAVGSFSLSIRQGQATFNGTSYALEQVPSNTRLLELYHYASELVEIIKQRKFSHYVKMESQLYALSKDKQQSFGQVRDGEEDVLLFHKVGNGKIKIVRKGKSTYTFLSEMSSFKKGYLEEFLKIQKAMLNDSILQ